MGDLVSPAPVLEVAIGVSILIAIIFIHGTGLRLINQKFSRSWAGVTPATPHWRINALLALTIASLTVVHLVETFIWAAPLYLLDVIPRMRDCYYFVLESYTTLGEGSVVLPNEWRLLGPIIAISGLFTFGWTGSVLVNVMSEFGKLDHAKSRKDRD